MAGDRDLVARLKAGNTEALEQLITRWRSGAEAYAGGILRDPQAAEDAVQETYITYMRKAPPFSDSEHEKAWLLTVAANKCRDMLRYRKRHITEPESVLDTLVQDSESSYILEALMILPDKFRIVLTLHYIDGYKVEEIAGMIGKSASAVKMRLQKGRKLLKEAYRKE